MSAEAWEAVLLQACRAPERPVAVERYLASHPRAEVRRSWAAHSRCAAALGERSQVEWDELTLVTLALRTEPATPDATTRLGARLARLVVELRGERGEEELCEAARTALADPVLGEWLEEVVGAGVIPLRSRPRLQQLLVCSGSAALLPELAAQLEQAAAVRLAERVNLERAGRGVGSSLQGLGVLAALPRGSLSRSGSSGDESEQPADQVWREGVDTLARLDECSEGSLGALLPPLMGAQLGRTAALVHAARCRSDVTSLGVLHELARNALEGASRGLTSSGRLELCLALQGNPRLPPAHALSLDEAAGALLGQLLPFPHPGARWGEASVWELEPAASGLEAACLLRRSPEVLALTLEGGGASACEVLAALAPSYAGSLRECVEVSCAVVAEQPSAPGKEGLPH